MTSAKNEDYCGFSCSDVRQKQQEIIDEVLDFNRYNPEYSLVMLGKLIEMLYESRNQMIRMKRNESFNKIPDRQTNR